MKGGDQVQDEEDDTETGRAAPQQSSLVVGLSEKSGLVHRSVKNASFASASASTAVTDTWHDNRSSIPVATILDHQSGSDDIIAARVRRRRQSFLDDIDLDPIKLPRSTHTLLYTEPINSLPFVISVCIEALSILCLILALISNGLTSYRDFTNKVPANVNTAVKTAQYTAIFIALLMEVEIPTGLYLLKRISRRYFLNTFPELNYSQFVCANALFVMMGYLFLINVFLIVIMSDNVMVIFFDFIALQFIQQLDGIAFKLARMRMLSTSMKEATTRRYFRTEFRRSTPGRTGHSFFFVAVYLFNLSVLLAGKIYVSVRQANGDYQCKSITARFREDIWREAIVVSDQGYEVRVLAYSYFNGVYVQDGNMHNERPVYVERRKFDGTEFDKTSPNPEDPYFRMKIPARIQYCNSIGAWVFMHENIRRSRDDNSDCPWLLRSEETGVFDIEEVNQMNWEVWQGVIETTDVRITCNECNDNEDCNLNGECKRDGSCDCSKDIDGRTFLGPHCEVILKDNCRTIIGERYNESYSVIDIDWLGSGQVWEAYNRPIYKYNLGSGNPSFDGTDDLLLLMYSGSRWFGLHFIDGAGVNIFTEEYRESTTYAIKNYHAFWDEVYTMSTIIVSDPVPRTGFTPVGVDFFTIGERGEQFGPFGVKLPLQLHNQTGRGAYRCSSSD